MRRSFWYTAVLTVALGGGILLRLVPARGENQGGIVSGSFNSVPWQMGATGQGNPTAQTKKRPSLPSVSPPPQGAGFPGTPGDLATTSGSHRSLGSLFELKRQETLLKREIAIKKLKDQLKGAPEKKILDTGTRGSPMTLLAAGIDGNRYAVIEWSDGRRIRVRQGENLPDGTRVVRIDGSGVSVKKRGKTVTYPYGESSGGRPSGNTLRFSGFSPPPFPMTGGHP